MLAMSFLSIGGFRIIDTAAYPLISIVHDRLHRKQRTELVFANTNFVMQCYPFRDALSGPDTFVCNDGIGMDLAAIMLHRHRFTANLNGTDLVPCLLRSFTTPTRVFLLGSTPFSVGATARIWSAYPNIEIVGAVDGFDGLAKDDALVEQLESSRPDVLLVALGNPRQEQWMIEHRNRVDVPLTIGVGALFDFVSGRTERAPMWVQRAHLEWMHRLAHEPRRLIKRYSIDIVRFFSHCLKTRREDVEAEPSGAR